MPGSPSSFDASSSALGYLHQFRSALLLALQRDDTPELGLSIEKLDDVSLHASDGENYTVVELHQHKLHLSRRGNLGDKSPDIWKTIRVWSEAIIAGRVNLERAQFCLVTTSEANDRNSIRWLRPFPHSRNSDEARAGLEQAGKSSTNDIVKEAYDALQRLDEDRRRGLFEATYLFDRGLDATAVRREIRRCIWSGCIESHRDAFVDRLEGWWINLVVNHLSQPNPTPIPIHAVQQQVHEIAAHFRRERLPDDLISAMIPADAIAAPDETNFVRQLFLLGISSARIQLAAVDRVLSASLPESWNESR